MYVQRKKYLESQYFYYESFFECGEWISFLDLGGNSMQFLGSDVFYGLSDMYVFY